jgi:dTDP-4-amino-4,6-dideoxygalactose transaminase
MRNHGQGQALDQAVIGWNACLDGIQAAVLRLKLQYLAGQNEQRRAHARAYRQALDALDGVVTPYEAPHGRHVYHLYVVRVPHRDALVTALQARGIQCRIHYPVPVHLQDAWRFLGYEQGSFPVAEACAAEFLSLPMFPDLTEAQIRRVVGAFCQCQQPDHAYAAAP